jgi:prepilin-type N-terminal cleavage/methylation domain-containing protein
MQRNAAAGFSLIELLIAMVVTLIVVGSMVGLLTSGQSAFSTQPERTDRQQNMRVAMDLIMKDVAAAGVGLPGFVQVFKTGEDGTGPPRPDGTLTDRLWMLTNTSGLDTEVVCHAAPAANGPNFALRRAGTPLTAGAPVIALFGNGTWSTSVVAAVGTTADCAGTAGQFADVTLTEDPNTGKYPSWDAPGASFDPPIDQCLSGAASLPAQTCPCNNAAACPAVMALVPGTAVRYEIILDPADNNLPALARTEGALGATEIVARGIEDLQVEYVQSNAVWPGTLGTVASQPAAVVNAVPPASPNMFTTLTTEVRVTLSARTVKQRIQGATQPGGAGTMALRGSLVSQGSPRQALWVLTQESPAPASPRWN